MARMFMLPMLLLIPAAVCYRYLPQRMIMPHVYYGSKTNIITEVKYFPHHVLIVYGTKYCSGSLIYSKIVVTAASCFIKNKGETVIVKVGASSMTGVGQIIPVMEYKIHEYFKQLGALDNDIALLVLESSVTFGSSVLKTVFVEPEVALRVGVPISMTGWGGTTMPVKYLNLLIKVEAIVLNITECQKLYGNLIKPSNYCVKYNSEQVLTDNGGGAVYDKILVGILSMGVTDKNDMNIAILTNVSYFHRWITLNTKRYLTKYCTKQEAVVQTFETDET